MLQCQADAGNCVGLAGSLRTGSAASTPPHSQPQASPCLTYRMPSAGCRAHPVFMVNGVAGSSNSRIGDEALIQTLFCKPAHAHDWIAARSLKITPRSLTRPSATRHRQASPCTCPPQSTPRGVTRQPAPVAAGWKSSGRSALRPGL